MTEERKKSEVGIVVVCRGCGKAIEIERIRVDKVVKVDVKPCVFCCSGDFKDGYNQGVKDAVTEQALRRPA